ncbi:hypothetical protein EG68_07973 [Paragonimus skrjabini miyazakii]|uniref:Uncharacterized protein n=1 Tax=Paragonimus skrjabini miyazakii TaxID=59628 RepID=A0A8S9YS40_9TREM|nr:hypothetical protein EG68_07973 [Paragonimus skrjabini miyazakii]
MFYGTPWADKNKSEAIDLQNCSTAVFDHLLTNEFSRSKNRWNSREEYSFMNRSTLLNIVHSTQCAQLDYFSTTKIRDDNTDGDVVDEHRTRPDLYCSTPCSEGNTSIQDWLSNLVYESAASTYGEQTTKDNDSSLSSVVPSESIFDSFESFGKPDYLQVNTTDDQKPDLCWNYYHSCTKEISPQGNSFSIANSNLVSHPYSEFSSNYESVHSHLRSGGPMCSQQEVIRSICDATISSMAVHSSSIKYTVDQEQNAIAHQTSEHQRPTENLPSTVRTVASQQQQQPVTSFIPNDHIFGGFTCSNQAAVSCSSSYTNEWNHLDAEFTEHTGDSNLDSCVSSGRRNPLDYRTSSHYNSPSCSEQMKHDTRQYPINAGAFNLLDSPFACHAPQNPTRAVMKRKLDDNHIGVQFKYGVANATTGFTVCGFGTPNRTTDNCQNNIDSEIHTPLSNFTIENCMTSTNSDHSSDQLATYNPALRGAFNFSVSTNTYFWQYNSQCKGPKAIRLFKLDGSPVRSENNSDEPDSTVGLWMGLDLYESSASASGSMVGEVTSSFQKSYTHSTLSLPDYPLIVFEDPVQRRYDLVHCSKLRRGDGNDVTPNLARLRAMGEELDKLSQLLIKHGEVIMAGTTTNTSLTSMVLGQQSTDNKCDHLSPEHRLIEQAKREKNKLASKMI